MRKLKDLDCIECRPIDNDASRARGWGGIWIASERFGWMERFQADIQFRSVLSLSGRRISK